MSFAPLVIGSTEEDQVNYGETIDLVITYLDELGAPLDLTSATVSIMSSAPPIIKSATVISVLDAVAGQVRFLLGRDDALSLRKGRNNWFRLQAVFGTDSDDVTPEIFIEVT